MLSSAQKFLRSGKAGNIGVNLDNTAMPAVRLWIPIEAGQGCRREVGHLAQAIGHLRLVEQIDKTGVSVRYVEQGGGGYTATRFGKLMLAILGAMAEFETTSAVNDGSDRIQKAKERKRSRGRPTTIEKRVLATLAETDVGAAAIAHSLGIWPASDYRVSVHKQVARGRRGCD